MRSFFERADDWLFASSERYSKWMDWLTRLPFTLYMLVTLSFFGSAIAVAVWLTRAIDG